MQEIYAIVDDESTIYSGDEISIKVIWGRIVEEDAYEELIGKHKGDLKLIQILEIWNG